MEKLSESLEGQYHNPRSEKMTSIQVEAVFDTDLYCWQLFCGRPETNNHNIVMKSSPFLLSMFNGCPPVKIYRGYCVDGHTRYCYCIFFTDGIYSSWAIFVKPIPALVTIKQPKMTKNLESRHKYVERLFGVLVGRFEILRYELHEWSDERISLIAETCVSIHNMIVRFHQDGLLNEECSETGCGTRVFH